MLIKMSLAEIRGIILIIANIITITKITVLLTIYDDYYNIDDSNNYKDWSNDDENGDNDDDSNNDENN